MKNLFIPYPLAVLAKEKGFTEKCISWYYKGEWQAKDSHIFNDFGGNDFNSRTDLNDTQSAPLYQQIVNWLRDKHEIDICIVPFKKPVKEGKSLGLIKVYDYSIYSHGKLIDRVDINLDYYKSLDKAIEESFKLI